MQLKTSQNKATLAPTQRPGEHPSRGQLRFGLFVMGFSFHVDFRWFCSSGNNRVIKCSNSRSSSGRPHCAHEVHGAKPRRGDEAGWLRACFAVRFYSTARHAPSMTRPEPRLFPRRKPRVALTTEAWRARGASASSKDRGRRNRVLCIQGDLSDGVLGSILAGRGNAHKTTERAFACSRD